MEVIRWIPPLPLVRRKVLLVMGYVGYGKIARPRGLLSGLPLPKGLPMVTMSGTTPCCSKAQKCFPKRPKPTWTLPCDDLAPQSCESFHPLHRSGCRKRSAAKGVRSLFFDFGTLSATFQSLFLMLLSLFSSLFLPNSCCRTRFAAA